MPVMRYPQRTHGSDCENRMPVLRRPVSRRWEQWDVCYVRVGLRSREDPATGSALYALAEVVHLLLVSA